MKFKYLVALAFTALFSTVVLAQTTTGTGCAGCGGSGEKPKTTTTTGK